MGVPHRPASAVFIPVGATITIKVTDAMVGRTLHRLENVPDVHLMHRFHLAHLRYEVWTLRSDRFPAAWEGIEIEASAHAEADDLLFKRRRVPKPL